MAITDNFDNTLLQLLQAQQVANSSGNLRLSAVISDAINSAVQVAGYDGLTPIPDSPRQTLATGPTNATTKCDGELYFGYYSAWGTPDGKKPYWVGCDLYVDIICVPTFTAGLPKLIATIKISKQFWSFCDVVQNKRTGKLSFLFENFPGREKNQTRKANEILSDLISTDGSIVTEYSRDVLDSILGDPAVWPQSTIETGSTRRPLWSALTSFLQGLGTVTSPSNDCCEKDDVIDIDNPCFDNWNLALTFQEQELSTVQIPAGYSRTSTGDFRQIATQNSIDSEETPVPNKPCYIGRKQTTIITSEAEYVYRKSCGDTVYTKTIKVLRQDTSESIWIAQRFDESKRGLKECQCEESYENAGVLLDTTDPCGCRQYNLVRVKLKCPGETEFRYSTEQYTEGLPPQIVLPLGHKLDPFAPFSIRGDCKEESIKIYHQLMLGKDIVEGKVTANTRGLFNLSQSMSCYLTSSLQSSASKEYYYEVTDCDCDSTPYFAVAYGHVGGSGSLASSGETNDTPTRAIYSQYRLIALDEPQTRFKFYSSGIESESPDIYAINFYRTGLSDRIDPGNFEIALRPLSGSAFANNVHTGSNVTPSGSTIYTFIDNSDDRSDLTSCSEDPYVSYDIVSGSLIDGVHSSGTGVSKTTYGKFYPNLGVMIFDPTKMNSLLNFNTVTGSNIAGDNAFKLYTSISGSGVLNSHIKARNVKYKTTNHYFVRVSPPNANYSNNPTYITGTGFSAGKIRNVCFQKDPVTYVTSIGLYNDKQELLAIAKLSKPIKKTSDDDLLIKIRLNW